jgi:hypothetical protein
VHLAAVRFTPRASWQYLDMQGPGADSLPTWSINSEESLVANSGLVGELRAFMRVRKKWWLLPDHPCDVAGVQIPGIPKSCRHLAAQR